MCASEARDLGSPGTRVTDRCVLRVKGAGNQTQALGKNRSALTHWAIVPALIFIFFFLKRIHNTKPQVLELALGFVEVVALGDLLLLNSLAVSAGLR